MKTKTWMLIFVMALILLLTSAIALIVIGNESFNYLSQDIENNTIEVLGVTYRGMGAINFCDRCTAAGVTALMSFGWVAFRFVKFIIDPKSKEDEG